MVAVAWVGGKVRFIDQTKLPVEEQYLETEDWRVIAAAIRSLQIRGAPAIGVAAAFGLCLALNDHHDAIPGSLRTSWKEAAAGLAASRPTAVNLFAALSRMTSALGDDFTADASCLRERALREAMSIQQEDVDACTRIGELGAALLPPDAVVLTHCNAGILATAGSGTALSIITTAARRGLIRNVYVDETRPLFQGARLTAWELARAGVPHTLITDNTAGSVFRTRKVNAVIVGADRIAANGDAANKIGTYPLAVLARYHDIPLYIAAPTTTIDTSIPDGGGIPIEERNPREVTHPAGVRVAPEGVKVFAPAFDVTPHELIHAIVTERGILHPPFAAAIAALRLPSPASPPGSSRP
jgi:methylthioribose-1-phosphate isomerase